MTPKELRTLGEDLHSKRWPLNSLWQEVADNLYPERADFTIWRPMGTDFASNLMSSFPVLCRRDLGNQIGAMLRPTARDWFHVERKFTPRDEEDTEVRRWLQWFEETMRRALYDRPADFVKATTQADHDFAAFGQTVLSPMMTAKNDGLLFRTWHLRDCAWQEDSDGKVDFVACKWKPTVGQMMELWGDKNHPEVMKRAEKSPFDECQCMHMVAPQSMVSEADRLVEGTRRRYPRWEFWYDCDHDHLIWKAPTEDKKYIIPRWQLVSSNTFGSQYAYSPATVAALPDSRLLQAMTFTLLEVSEKAANPPLIATRDAIRSDMAVFAGGVTWVDREYDEKLGEALRPLNQDFRGYNFGAEERQDIRQMLTKAFYLDKLTMPQRTAAMTAYEVGQRVQEYIRDALPLFGPMEMEYSAALCDETFAMLRRRGAFGPESAWPKALQQADIDFSFESPLHDAVEAQNVQKFQECIQLTSQVLGLDQSAAVLPNAIQMLRDGFKAIRAPATWVKTDAETKDAQKAMQQQAQQSQALDSMVKGSTVVKNLGPLAGQGTSGQPTNPNVAPAAA